MPGSITVFSATANDEVARKTQPTMMGTRQPPPVAPRTTSITLQSWQQATAAGDNNDGNDRYARSASTDSLESSGSSSSGGGSTSNRITDVAPVEYIPTRTLGKAPKLPPHNPLQFVKVQSPLYKKAEQQIKLTKEVKITREALKEGEEEWQSNLDNWKSRRRKASEKVIQRAEEMRQIEAEEQLRQEQLLQQQKKIKKFSEMVEKKATRSYNLDLYIGQGDDSGLGGTPEPDDTLDCHSSHLRSDTSEGMTSEAESIDSDIHKSDKILEKEPPKVPLKPYSRFKKCASISYDDPPETTNELFQHHLSRQDLTISDNISSTEPSDVEGHAADTEATSSEEDATFSGQTGNIDSGLESLGDNQRGNLADSASDLSQDSISSLEKNNEKPDLDLITDGTEVGKENTYMEEKEDCKKETKNDIQTTDLQNQPFKICIKPGDSKGFGFTLKGGKDHGCPAYIDNVLKDGPADEIGLKDGDKITFLNGEPTADYSHASLIFSVKQAAYTGILDLIISRSPSHELVNNDLKSKETRKGKSFAEKLAIFSSGVNNTSAEESKSNVKIEAKRESLVLRRRSAFENGKAENVNVLSRRASCVPHSVNASSEKLLEKRHSVDLTIPQNASHENNFSKKGPPPPVPVKPKIKSKPIFFDVNKSTSNKLNGSHENSSPPTESITKDIVNETSKSQNVLPDSPTHLNTDKDKHDFSNSDMSSTDQALNSDELGHKSLLNNAVAEEPHSMFQVSDNICEENLISLSSEPQIIDSYSNFDAAESQLFENCLANFEQKPDEDINQSQDLTYSLGLESGNETGDLSPTADETNKIETEVITENIDDFQSDIQTCTEEVFINEKISPDETPSLDAVAQIASECAIDTANEIVLDNYSVNAVVIDTDVDTNSSYVTSACHSKCDMEDDESHILESKDLETVDESEVTESKNNIQTNPSPLCLSLEKIDEDDVISASTTTSSDTPDTETVIETLPSNFSPLPNDESNGEDSSKLLNCQEEESEQPLETTEVNEMSSRETCHMTETNYLDEENFDPSNELGIVESVPEPYSDSVTENVDDSATDKAFYDDQQDDEYARELDESLDQITSLDIIDRIEQSLMDQLQQDAVYEDIDTNLNDQLEGDVNSPWLYFTEESELLDDLTPRNVEPPREPPPPPPPPETESSDNKVSVSRTNSTKRIKKEIWRRRSDFLGLDSPEAIDVDNIPPPPVGLEELLKQEREQTQWLEKQLSLADPEIDISSYTTESACLDSGNYSNNDYSEYFVDENTDACKDAVVNSQSEEWKENMEEDTLFENTFGVQYESSASEQLNPVLEDTTTKTTESPQHKAKQNIHSLGAAPKAKIMDSTKWITEKVGTVSKKSIEPVFRQTSYNQNYWLAQDGERRRSMQYHEGQMVDRRYSMPPVYSNTHPDVTVRTWGDREYEYQQHRPRSAIYDRSGTGGNMYDQYVNMDKKDLQRTQSLDSHREMNYDTDTLESEVHKCSCCGKGLCEGSAMGIEALRLYFHIECFRCCLCHIQLGNGSCGTDVQVKNNQLYCPACFTID